MISECIRNELIRIEKVANRNIYSDDEIEELYSIAIHIARIISSHPMSVAERNIVLEFTRDILKYTIINPTDLPKTLSESSVCVDGEVGCSKVDEFIAKVFNSLKNHD